MKRYYILYALILLLCSREVMTQSFYNYRRDRDIIVSLGTGTTSYFGDLNDDGDYFDARPNLNLGLQYFFTNRISVRGELGWFQLQGADEESTEVGKQLRNLSFISNNYELDVVGIIQAWPDGAKYYQRPKVNLYGFVGIGALYFNPKAELNGEKYALQPIQTEGVSYSRITIVIPYGLGVRYRINPFWNIALEGGFRQTFTDYIDDVSTTYIDNASFSDPTHAALADRGPEIGEALRPTGGKRGDPSNNDNYFLMNIKVEYYLPADFFSTSLLKSKRHRRKNRRR